LDNLPSVGVIVPTTCAPTVERAIKSVVDQYYGGQINIHVVVDGFKFVNDIKNIPTNVRTHDRNLYLTTLPNNTGKEIGNFYGHRIYAAFAHLVNEDYIFHLDQDNWYREDHVSSLIEVMENDTSLTFAHSLRNIYDDKGNFLFRDHHENLGNYPIWGTTGPGVRSGQFVHLIDTSAYAFNRVKYTNGPWPGFWHYGYAGDRMFLQAMMNNGHKFGCNGKYTLQYSLGGNELSGSLEFHRQGNEWMDKKYNGKFPWSKE